MIRAMISHFVLSSHEQFWGIKCDQTPPSLHVLQTNVLGTPPRLLSPPTDARECSGRGPPGFVWTSAYSCLFKELSWFHHLSLRCADVFTKLARGFAHPKLSPLSPLFTLLFPLLCPSAFSFTRITDFVFRNDPPIPLRIHPPLPRNGTNHRISC